MGDTSAHFLLLCGETVGALAALGVREDERELIAPNPEWIADAAFVDDAVSYGVFSAGEAVGLLSLIDPRLIADEDDGRDRFQSDCLYLWRLMVDRRHRGRGYGRAAIEFAARYAALTGLAGVSLTTMDRIPGNALALYRALGFEPTGRRLDDEIELVRRHELAPRARHGARP